MTRAAVSRRLVLILLSLLVAVRSCDAFLCNAWDSEALLEFKAGFLDPGGYFSTWIKGTDCCWWGGVNCTADGRVKIVWIEPSYPPQGEYPQRKPGPLQANFGESLGRLERLEELGLCNVIFDAPAPKSIGNLSLLSKLKLEANGFTGPIPPSYGGLQAMKFLRLNSKLTGVIPRELCTLIHLESLDLSNNFLRGSIPECLVFLQNLTVIDFSNNGLTGAIPTIMGSFGNLKILNLRNNQLSSSIPEELCHLWNLNSLNLAQNQLTGHIPSKLSLLRNLFSIDLAQNRLSGPIPKELGSLPNLMFLSLFSNFLTGSIPKELADLPAITSIHLSHNRLSGGFPPEFGNVPARLNLQMDVSGNSLSGDIPDTLSNLGSFWASDNYFRGSFPLSLTAVETVVLSNNRLCSLDVYATLPSNVDLDITTLRLDNNRIYGRIPSWFKPQLSQLSVLDLSRNKISGEFPYTLLTLPSLSKVNCSNNRIGSHLPSRILVSNVDTLDLHSNEITGSIMETFLGSLPKLTYLDLSSNKLSGKVPDSILKPPMNFLGLDNNTFRGNVPKVGDVPATKKYSRYYYAY